MLLRAVERVLGNLSPNGNSHTADHNAQGKMGTLYPILGNTILRMRSGDPTYFAVQWTAYNHQRFQFNMELRGKAPGFIQTTEVMVP